MTINIASRAELYAALARATGGETFVLASGNYGDIGIEDAMFAKAVTIRSADPLQMAKFTSFKIEDSRNIKLEALDIGRAMAKHEEGFGKIVSVLGSEHVSLTDMKIHGKLDGSPRSDGYGLFVKGSSKVAVKDSEFTELTRGAVFDRSSDLIVENNHFHNLRSDGADFAGVQSVLIKNNRFSDFYIKPGDHSDAIQFFSTGQTRASTDIVITGNQIFEGNGFGPQGIFLRDQTGRLPYENVTIENNIIYGNDSHHGIAVLGGKQVSITNNTAVSQDTDHKNFWIKVEKVSGAVVQNNVTDVVIIGRGVSGLNESGNLQLTRDDAARDLVPNLNKGAQTVVADLVIPGVGYDPTGATPSPAPAPWPTPVPAGTPASIFGTSDHDNLRGTDGDEKLHGFAESDATLGAGTRDVMLGEGGDDLFVLGDSRGAFYNDSGDGDGRHDYASIRDFAEGDQIQLAGQASDYILKSEHFGRAGVSIYLDTNADGSWSPNDEFVAHVSGSVLPIDIVQDHFVFG